jgi:type II secretory pathway component PulC
MAFVLATGAFADNFEWNSGKTELSPNLKYRTFVGYYVDKVESGSVYDKIGLKSGDNVVEVNDTALTDPKQAVEQFKLFDASPDSLTVERGDKQIKLKK